MDGAEKRLLEWRGTVGISLMISLLVAGAATLVQANSERDGAEALTNQQFLEDGTTMKEYAQEIRWVRFAEAVKVLAIVSIGAGLVTLAVLNHAEVALLARREAHEATARRSVEADLTAARPAEGSGRASP